MEGRNIATRSVLPHWEGVCLDDAGKEMTAWDAIQKVQNVAHCMKKRNTKEGQNVYSYDLVHYNFGKVRAISCLNVSWNLYYISAFSNSLILACFLSVIVRNPPKLNVKENNSISRMNEHLFLFF